jgi:ribosomal-protein-alanine N-acetyltransferase
MLTEIDTPRLRLRPLVPGDAAALQRAAAAHAIADTMISVPHPYPPGEAARFIAHCQVEREAGRGLALAIEGRAEGDFIGLIEVRAIEPAHAQAELSFWLVETCWGLGYMSEAVRAIVGYAFTTFPLNRLYAHHMTRNPASGRVLERNGFQREGVLRQRVRKWGRYEDVALWALVREDWPGADGSVCKAEDSSVNSISVPNGDLS